MKKQVAERWVAALRSGQYKQGTQTLIQLNLSDGEAVPSFCCLGVLCDLLKDEPEIKGKWEGNVFKVGKRKQSLVLPYPVLQFAGMLSDHGAFVRDRELLALATLNDKDGFSFSQLADVIENNWQYI